MKAKIRAILEKYGIDDYHWKPEITKELSDLFKELLSKAVIQPVTAKDEQETNEQPVVMSRNKTDIYHYFDICEKCGKEYYHNKPYHLTFVKLLCPDCVNEQPKRVSAEKFKNKIYDKIRDDLKDARMEGWNTDDGDKYPLLDFLSKGNTIEGGLSEIDNIVEQIDIDDLIEEFASQHPEQEKIKPKFSAANILSWIQDGHAVPPGNQKDLLNYMISFVNHFTLIEQEKPSEQSAEEFLKSLSIFSYSDIELIAPIMRKYSSQKHPVTDDVISAKLDTVNFETSKERETAFDLLVWLRDKIK